MEVPLLDLKAQYARIKDEIRHALERVIESQVFILGPEVESLEREIAAYSGTKFAVGVSSGTDGLLVALMALGIEPGDEVITTTFSFFATAGVIARLKAVPVFVDIDPVSFNLDPGLLEKAITPRTKAIIPVHLFGQCADMSPIQATAERHGIPIIEDACQSIGAEYKGMRAGSLGEIGVFSFFPSKNLGGFGDGGMVVMNNVALYEKIKLLRRHGATKTYHHELIGGNFRLDALQAAILRVKLKYLDTWSASRRANAEYYSRSFAEMGLYKEMHIQPPAPIYAKSGDTHYHIYNQYTIRADRRDGLQAYLKDNGIGTAVYYPLPLHLQDCFKKLGHKLGDFPVAEKAAREVLSIPIYPELMPEQKEHVAQIIGAYYLQNIH